MNVYFINDPHSPTTLENWHNALKQVKEELGLTGIQVQNTAELFLEARERDELLKESA